MLESISPRYEKEGMKSHLPLRPLGLQDCAERDMQIITVGIGQGECAYARASRQGARIPLLARYVTQSPS